MIRFAFSLTLLFLSFNLFAQSFVPNPDWRFESFNSQNHFISRDINNVTVDKDGYVWASSWGVQKFDGYKTTDYQSFDNMPGGIRDNSTSVIADSSGRIWVSSGGLCYYNGEAGKFIYVDTAAKHHIGTVFSMYIKKNMLWFICECGLARLDLKTLKIAYTALTYANNPLIISEIGDDSLWVSYREKNYIYDIKKDSYTANTIIYDHSLVKVFSAAHKGKHVFIGTNTGLFELDDPNNVKTLSKGTPDIEINDMLFLPQDKEKKYLFLATDGSGLMVYDTGLKKIVYTYVHDDNNIYSLSNNIISNLYADKKGRLWIATALGISMLDLNNQQWKMRFLDKNTELYVNKIAADKFDHEKVWMSSFNQGMISVNWNTKHIEKIFDAGGEIRKLHDFVQVSKNKWLLATQKEVLEWGPQTGIIYKQAIPVSDSLGLVYNIRRIIFADVNTCFITTDKGLYKYNLINHKITVAANTKSKSATEFFKYDLNNGICDSGILWIASRNGLFTYNVATGKAHIYGGKTITSDFFLFDIARAPNNQLVCATGDGIIIFNKQTQKFTVVNSFANFFKPTCVSVTCLNNKVYIGVEAGIINYNLATHKSVRAEYQTPLMQVFPSSPFTIINNDIVLGYRNGYAYFTPGVKNNTIPSNPFIEKVTVNNQAVLWNNLSKQKTQKPSFNYSENSVNIAFTSFLYTSPDDISFRYRLQGGNPNWQYVTEQRSVNYEQLPPGNYTFYAQCGNKNGAWNSQLASFSFKINPPYWATWWFRVLVVLAIAFGLYQIYIYKINHIKAIESIRQSIASDFHDDLGSTLSSISIFSEVAIQKAETDLPGTKSMLGDIGTRARAMIHSMNDMVWIIKPENDNLYRLMQRMEEFGYPVAEAKEINLSFDMDESLYDIKTDMIRRKNLFLIFKEAFNNAVKYSNANNIEVHFKLKQKKLLFMQIVDNGDGFDHTSKKEGNGLGNMQKRAMEINGKLKISAKIGAGTSISVFCKIT